MRTFRLLVSLSVALSATAASSLARGDCALPRSYSPTVAGNQVTICPTDPDSHATPGCPAAGGMLRVDVAHGAITKLPDVCTDAGAYSCYVDDCVAPGTYQYGYGTPYQCGDGCNTAYFVQVSVAEPLSACTSDAGADTATASAPWDASVPRVGAGNNYGVNPTCPISREDGGPGDVDAAYAPITRDAGPTPDSDARAPEEDASPMTIVRDGGQTSTATSDGTGGNGGDGCSLVRPSRTERSVLAIDGLALLLGLSFFGRRRTKG